MTPSALPPASQRSVQLAFSDQPAWIVKDEVDGGWVLQIGGAEQSHVDLADPTHIVHEYLLRMTHVLDAFRPAREPIRIAHLGAGALTLARYVQTTRPGSAQLTIEIERELPTLVTTALPLPVGTDLEIVIGDAREELAAMDGRRFDALVIDVFSGESSPPTSPRRTSISRPSTTSRRTACCWSTSVTTPVSGSSPSRSATSRTPPRIEASRGCGR